ncbi:MAG: hypothetical protein IKW57_04505 [Alphaproteobacteria bacterium]|nr:hypothetical protein [Alphaproteobacteria bacterium]
MKTKIIYISGGEVFEMTKIRAALDEVRNVLGLDKETVLFGVPVDDDNAIDTATEMPQTECQAEDVQFTPQDDALVESDAESDIEEVEKSDTEMANDDDLAQICEDIPLPQPVAEIEPVDVSSEQNNETSEKIIPILSILSAQEETTEPTEQDETVITEISDEVDDEIVSEHCEEIEISTEDNEEDVIELIQDESNDESATEQFAIVEPIAPNQEYISNPIVSDNTPQIFDISVDTELTAPITDDEMPAEPQTVTISDMISDEAPEMPVEKTLEQLLESMKPLREDLHNEQDDIATAVVPDDEVSTLGTDTDATLAQLATEFAKNEDKISKPSKSESTGKIGKLKNILPLPFSKQKNKDTSLMGDLFGWAGIAANDDEISLPGFFTTNVSANKVHNDQE